MSIRHFTLGLLARRPMSGYDIKRFLDSLSWLIDSPSFGSLYPALHALLEDGLVTVEVVSRQGRPSRKIYTITQTGKQALQEWLDEPVASGVSLKAFVMRLVLAGNLSHAGLVAHLQQRRAQVATHQIALEQTAGAMDGSADLGERLALDYGLAIATAELACLDRTLAQLSQPSLPAEAARGGFDVPAVLGTRLGNRS
jgi:DNA-binding PadR family transcriptional regulator